MLLLSIVLIGCIRGGAAGPVGIEPLRIDGAVAASPGALAAYEGDLAAVLRDGRIRRTPDDAAAIEAVRSREASAAIVRVGPQSNSANLDLTEIERVPLAFFVSLTLPIEGISAAQARELAGGGLRNWRELGGPQTAVEVLVRDPALVAAELDKVAAAGTVEDVAAALSERRGRLVIAPGTGAGALVKPLRIDGLLPGDDGYPFAVTWAVASRPGNERGAALARAIATRAAERAGREIVLDAVGDIMLDRGVGAAIATHGARYPFEATAPLFAGSDIRIGNLELPLTERGQRAAKDYTFRAPPSVAEGLAEAGFSVLSLANNHILDYGAEGLLDTIAALDRAGIAHPGAGRTTEEAHRPAVLTVRGLRVAILSHVNTPNDGVSGWVAESMRAGPTKPGVAWATAESIRRDVTAAKAQADLVIVALHAGGEYLGPPNALQRELARAAVDAGAALVLGAHPHVLQGIELYNGVPIVYSLGNFVFDADADDRRQPGMPTLLSCVLRVRLGPEGVRSLEVRPTLIEPREGRPLPVSGAAARPVYERIYSLTDTLMGR